MWENRTPYTKEECLNRAFSEDHSNGITTSGRRRAIVYVKIGFEITLHDKMPDVVLYHEDKDWLYFIESVTSVGPMDDKRIVELQELTKNVNSGKIFVTAFLDFKTFKKFSETLAWDTEGWIADMPDHMIHLNGDRFLGPR